MESHFKSSDIYRLASPTITEFQHSTRGSSVVTDTITLQFLSDYLVSTHTEDPARTQPFEATEVWEHESCLLRNFGKAESV